MNRRDFHRLGALAALAQGSLVRPVAAQTATAASKPKLSVMLWTLGRQMPVDAQVDIAAKAGYAGVELLGDYKTWKPDQMAAFQAKLKSTGMVVDSMVSGSSTLVDPDKLPALVSSVTASIPFAKDFGCSQFILTAGVSLAGQAPEAKRTAIVDALKRVSDATAKDNIEVLLEPIDLLERKNSAVTSVTEGFEIVREVARPNIKVLYDFYHEQRGAGNLLQKLDGNLELVGLVHIADVPKRTAPGTGEVNYINIYKRLAEMKYNRWIAMEFYPTGDAVSILKTARTEVEKAFAGA
ncbi:MAG TPA: TIM barrel protein [Bryobacteraceae bacterium]|nr:TIM barrel protein [Bryobacteraceae bacterium]